MEYFHSVTLDKSRCHGCTNCITNCPTEAIRVQGGKAKIIKERCIDCGECIKVCPYYAKKAATNKYEEIFDFKYKIALPAPSLYGQFSNIDDVNIILTGLKLLGFDEIFEISKGADIISKATNELIKKEKLKKPIINSACPAVVRLIRVRFPNLIDHILPLQSPLDVAARLSRESAVKKTGLNPEDIGIFFISPCAAKMTSVKSPLGIKKSDVDGVIAMKDIVSQLVPFINKIEKPDVLSNSSRHGIGWANSGGESSNLELERCICVDSIHNVIKVLEDVEDEKLDDIDFVECLACTGGCVGGPLTVENPFVAKAKIKRIIENIEFDEEISVDLDDLHLTQDIEYLPVMNLGETMSESIDRMEKMRVIYEEMPKLDCGSCGAPSCNALAEDIVRGFGKESDRKNHIGKSI